MVSFEYLFSVPEDWHFVNPFTTGLLVLFVLGAAVFTTGSLLKGIAVGGLTLATCYLLHLVLLFATGMLFRFLSNEAIVAISFLMTSGLYIFYLIATIRTRHMTAQHSLILSNNSSAFAHSPTEKKISDGTR